MATESVLYANRPPMTVAELVAFTKKELNADAERQAQLHAASAGEVRSESQEHSSVASGCHHSHQGQGRKVRNELLSHAS